MTTSAKHLLKGLGIDLDILDSWSTSHGWSLPIGTASPKVAEPIDHGDSPSVETGLGSHTQTLEPVESNAGSFVFPGITLASALDSRLNPIAALDGEVGTIIHRYGTSFDTVTTNALGFRHDADAGSGGGSAPKTAASAPAAAVGGIATTRMDAAVATSGLLAASATPAVVESRVAAAGDDVEERTTSGSKSNNVNDLELGYDGSSPHTVGLRFTGIDIPQGAVITNAYIQFRTDQAQTGAASLLIRGEDTDDASPFTAASFNVAARAKTDASAAWAPAPWAVAGEAGLAQRTPDLTAIVQEIVSRSGWAALNDMAFLVTGTGTRTATSYEKLATGAPLLHIEYQMPGPASMPVAFNTPADANSTANQIAELATAGTAVGITAAASDPDAGSTVTYSLNDTRFVIDAVTGVITRSATGTLDFETQASINLAVTATSSDGSVANQSFTLGVLDSPEPVAFAAQPDADAATNRIAQNAAAGTVVGVTASARDPDAGASVTYSLNDPRFAIDAATGVITRSGTGTLNAQAEPSVTLNVTATSSDGSVANQTFTLAILDTPVPVAFNVPADADATANQIAELATAGTTVGIIASASDPDAGSTVTYSLNDTRFVIDATTGVITRSATGTLDFETQASINLTVTATSSDGSVANQSFTLAVLDRPEAVAFNAQPDGNAATDRIAQNAAAGTTVGITASARDPDAGASVTYSLNDPRFAIDAATGVITRSSTGTLNAQAEPSITLNVTATSSDGSTDTHAYSVSVGGAVSATPTVLERRVGAAGDDVEQRTTSGSMSSNVNDLELGYDGSSPHTVGLRFTGIDIPQGAVITNAYIQFRTDQAQTGAASLLIRGEDNDDSNPFTATSFNVSARAKTDASAAWAAAPWAVAGEAGLAQRTPDLTAIVQEIVSRSGWAALNDMAFLVTGTGTRTATSYEKLATGAPLLHIEYQMPGPVSMPVAFNTPADANSTANQIAELATAGAAVGIIASASDPDAGSSVTYSLNDTRFVIDAVTGVITRSGAGTLDFETQASINLTVTATSSDGSVANQTFSLAVLNSPEPVAFNAQPDANAATNRIAQNAAAGTAVGVTASARDPDAGASVTYSLNDTRFVIDAATGVITRSSTGTLNAQAEPSITLNVTATSSDGSTAAHAYSVSVGQTAGPQTLFRFAVFGDFGDTDLSGEKAISALVHSWNADFVLTVGDNTYAPQTFDTGIGQQYHDYIGNYHGSYGNGSAINRFFPTLGNHEYDDGNVPAYLNYFTLPDNERYYDFQVGPVHLFALNSNKEDPDGRSSTSVQAQWMQSVLANSDASFNIAYFHHTAFNPSGSTSTMRWPFEPWGVDAVFAGHQHNYYRENRDDNGDGVALPYTTTGLGGAGRSVPDVGANLVTITDAGMLIEFYTVSSFTGGTATSVLKDSYFVPTPAGRAPTLVDGGYVLTGTAGADYLWGLGGNSTLNGGRGNDMLVGGNGRNLYVFHVGDGQDTVANFVSGAGIGDTLDLRVFGIDNASKFAQVAMNQGANVVAELGGGDRLTLLGVQLQQFHDNDFRTDLLV